MVGVEDAFPVDAGRTEVEATYAYVTAARAFDDTGVARDRGPNRAHEGTLTLTHGFTGCLDAAISLFGGSFRDEDERRVEDRGVGDLVVNAKWRFRGEGDRGLHLAWRPALTIPVGNDAGPLAPGLGFWTLDQMLVATWIRERWVLGADAGVQVPVGDRDGARAFVLANLGAGYQLSSWLKPELELNFFHDFLADAADPQALVVTVGAILNPLERLRVDLGLRHGVYGRSADRQLSVTANLSWTF